jgi:leader peptidase (prepilin peptidase)/N-methyltransferase
MMEPLAVVLGAVGLGIGLGADRLATAWPEHDEEHPPGRAIDWRTAVAAIVGAVALGLLPLRFGSDPLAIAIFGAWFVTLILGLATDLDQRLLPNVLTLPVIPVALLYALSGRNPLVGDELLPALVAAVVIPIVLYLPSIPFGAGAFGLGDVNLLAGMGLMLGGSRTLGAVIVALALAGVVLLVLLATRRVSRHSYVPFGPFFIIGALWAVLIRT